MRGLTISAGFGVRDNNELSWSQVVDHVAFMAEATSIPLLLDGDTGYGNFNCARAQRRHGLEAGRADQGRGEVAVGKRDGDRAYVRTGGGPTIYAIDARTLGAEPKIPDDFKG